MKYRDCIWFWTLGKWFSNEIYLRASLKESYSPETKWLSIIKFASWLSCTLWNVADENDMVSGAYFSFWKIFNAVLHQLESPYVYTKLIGAQRPWKISGYLFHGTLFVTEISSWSNFQLDVIKEQAVMPLTQISRNYEFESKILIVLVFLITLALSRLLSREVMLGENIREISLDGTWNGGVGRTGRLAPVSLLDTRGGCLWGIVSLANSK